MEICGGKKACLKLEICDFLKENRPGFLGRLRMYESMDIMVTKFQ